MMSVEVSSVAADINNDFVTAAAAATSPLTATSAFAPSSPLNTDPSYQPQPIAPLDFDQSSAPFVNGLTDALVDPSLEALSMEPHDGEASLPAPTHRDPTSEAPTSPTPDGPSTRMDVDASTPPNLNGAADLVMLEHKEQETGTSAPQVKLPTSALPFAGDNSAIEDDMGGEDESYARLLATQEFGLRRRS